MGSKIIFFIAIIFFIETANAFMGFANWSAKTSAMITDSFETWDTISPLGWSSTASQNPTHSSSNVSAGTKSVFFSAPTGSSEPYIYKVFDLTGKVRLRIDVTNCSGVPGIFNVTVTGGCNLSLTAGVDKTLNISSCAGPNKTVTIANSYEPLGSNQSCYIDNLRID